MRNSMEDFDVAKAAKELKELRKLIPQEEDDWEEIKRQAVEYYKDIPMHDWGAGQDSNEHDMLKKYGRKYINTIRHCEHEGWPISKNLISNLHRIHEGKKPYKKKAQNNIANIDNYREREKIDWDRFEKKKDLKPAEYNKKYYSNVSAGIINMVRTCKVLRNPTTLLFYLLQRKPWEGKKDKHDTYEYWYLKKNLIVASVSIEKISADLGVHEKTVRNWIDLLHDSGIIKKLKIGIENIYVLGEVIDKGELYYYAGEASWK